LRAYLVAKEIDWAEFWSAKAVSGGNFSANGRSLVSEVGFMHIIDEVVTNLKLGRNSRLADLGCGTGMISMALAPWVRSISAVDISQVMVRKAGENLKGFRNCSVRIGNITNSGLRDNSCDGVLSYSVVQYLKNRENIECFLNEINRVLEPGGRAFIGANPDPGKRDLYESIVRKTRSSSEAKDEIALLDEILWIDPVEFGVMAQTSALSAEISTMNSRIWNHFYMYNITLTKC
jgi:SAM-dependent methyltransferase